MKDIDKIFYEIQQRFKWWVNGIGIHGISGDLFFNLSTERICELYNVEITYFRPN